jgi:HSP20 family molecular chaperone IbpA
VPAEVVLSRLPLRWSDLEPSSGSPRTLPDSYLPGVDPDAIELTVEQNVMTVKAERSWPPVEGDEILVSEREEGSFSRQVFLGEGLDIDHLVARYAHGVLGADDRRAQAGRARQRKSRDRC